ncbi:MAG: MFS transporter, partial [Aestuariivirga sp.]
MPTPLSPRFPLFSLEPRIKILHYSWFAFFISFVVWFNLAPLAASIRDTFNLTKPEVAALLTLNVALAIPGRVLAGVLVDKIGPR